ncbi:MAG: hypothetical protein IKN43_12195 [Selenomonadaceae bacterium]|nr:hypothetical protein [Selenomonadaceae bacterium]
MNIDLAIEKTIRKEIQASFKSEFKNFTEIIRSIIVEELKNIAPNGENLDDDLITVREAREKTKLNPTEFKKLVDNGTIKYKTSPKGRKKIIKSSLIAYIRGQ